MSNMILAGMMMLSGMADAPLPDVPATAAAIVEADTRFSLPAQPPPPMPAVPDAQDAALPAEATPEAPPAEPAPTEIAAQEEEDGDALVITGRKRSKEDPFASVNAKSFALAQTMDKAVVGPISTAYKKGLPGPVRRGFANFVSNLHEPIVFLNDLLQLRPRRALKTLGRFTLNTTVGLAGTIDVAKSKTFKMPGHWNSFADTLGVWGVKPGPFFFVPLLGPTTARDFAANFIDRLVLPFSVGKPFNQSAYTATTNVGHALDYRSERDDEVAAIRASADPYVTSREQYLRRRRNEIAMLRDKRLFPTPLETRFTDAEFDAPTAPAALEAIVDEEKSELVAR